ncbi:IclR family transcriptional regulator [Qipengyuania sp. GH25]|uniref:IclR family transcriptional regulator n=1 Tax=Qipengyuania pacifica TaxID=2860199 RepID=A0ABS7JD16_9SPHN|nr:IclR family transcriptional regulator [Qipengyuania aerophila]MBX7487921.1 IclR family transcriptional regulator [Qipengyuania aerophila]
MAETKDKVQAAITTSQVLKALGRSANFAPLGQIAREAGMPAAKAHRYLQALIEEGMASQDPMSGHYGLGPEIISIGAAALGRIDLAKVAGAPLEELRNATGATCLLSVWGNHGATVVRVLQSVSAITVVTRLGSVLPLQSATGLIFAAFLEEERLNLSADYKSFRRQFLALPEGREAIAKIRAETVTNIAGLLVTGIDAVAAPVLDAEKRCAAVVCSLGPAATFDADLAAPPARAVRDCANEISRLIGYQANTG